MPDARLAKCRAAYADEYDPYSTEQPFKAEWPKVGTTINVRLPKRYVDERIKNQLMEDYG